MIQNIAEGTFQQLQDLEAIDLRQNALQTIPPELFRLPLLRNLYVQNNYLTYLNYELEKIEKPIIAPLQKIDLSECKLDQVPNFGILPQLHTLNLSGNALSTIKSTDFSPYCHLKLLDLNNTRTKNICTCSAVVTHLIARSVNVIRGQNCIQNELCANSNQNKTEELLSYYECLQVRIETAKKEKSTITWITISMCLVGFFVIFIGFLYCLHKRNTRQIKRQLKKQSNFNITAVEPQTINEKGNEHPVKEPYEKDEKHTNHEKLLDVDKS